MYAAFAVFLVLHGFAHLVGFVGSWELAASVPPQNALLAGRIPLSLASMRWVGIFWAIIALAFVIPAVGIMRQTPWWPAATLIVAFASLVLCVLGLPQAKVGAIVDVVIIAGVLLMLWSNGGVTIPS
jgi:hypothetical protein